MNSLQDDFNRAQRTVDEMTPTPPWPLRLYFVLIVSVAVFIWASAGLLAWLLSVVLR